MTTENTEVAVTEVTAVTPKEKVQISVEAIKLDLINGLNRKEIAVKYGAPVTVINRFFKHPSLKGIRPKHKSMFELVVDGETVPVNAIPNEKVARPVKEVVEAAEVAPTETDTTTPSGSIADRVSEQAGI